MVKSNTLMNSKKKIVIQQVHGPILTTLESLAYLSWKPHGPLVVYIVSFYYKNFRVMAHNYNDIIEIKSKTHKIKWTIFNGFFHQVDGISEEKATECLQLREEGPHSVGYNTWECCIDSVLQRRRCLSTTNR